jgi:hypothetical protein
MIPYAPVFVVVISGEVVRRVSRNKTESLSPSPFPNTVFVDAVGLTGVEIRTAVVGI